MADSPYAAPGFYDRAIASGRHRDIVGGRWEETGRVQMDLLKRAGLLPRHHLLDIGAGALRLGCKAVGYLERGHYWATDFSRDLMLAGHAAELEDPSRLDPDHLVQDTGFDFPGIPETITHAIAFAVFPHLPIASLHRALTNLHRFPELETVLFTVFLAPDAAAAALPYRQKDGVVTHRARAPYHLLPEEIVRLAADTGWTFVRHDTRLPRGQILFAGVQASRSRPDG